MNSEDEVEQLRAALEAATKRIEELEDENIDLRDDTNINAGGFRELRQQRRAYRKQAEAVTRERDGLLIAINEYKQRSELASGRSYQDFLNLLEQLKREGEDNALPFVVRATIADALKAQRERHGKMHTELMPRFQIDASGETQPNALNVLLYAGSKEMEYGYNRALWCVVTGILSRSDDERVVCAEIVLSLRYNNTVPFKVFTRLPKTFLQNTLKPAAKPQTLRLGLIQAHQKETGRKYDDDISDRQMGNYKAWYQTVKDTAGDILQYLENLKTVPK